MILTTINLLNRIKDSIFILFGIILAFLAPIIPLILCIFGAIFIDTIFGIKRALVIGQPITSRRLSQVIYKLFLYNGAIILFFCVEKYILNDFILLISSIPLFLTKIISILFIGIEMMSINENYKAVTGVSLYKKIMLLLKRTKETKDSFKKILNEDDIKILMKDKNEEDDILKNEKNI